MKHRVIFFHLILVIFNLQIKGQTDSVSLDSISGNAPELTGKHKYLDANFKQEKTLIKFGISPINFLKVDGQYSNSNISSLICFEKKIVPSLSIIAFQNILYYYSNNNSSFQFSNDIGVRYYYSIRKRIVELIGSNNFNNNYLSLKIDDLTMTSFSLGQNDVFWRFEPSLNLSWGIQKRLSNWGFVDLGPYLKFRKNTFSVGFNFLFGLGWGF